MVINVNYSRYLGCFSWFFLQIITLSQDFLVFITCIYDLAKLLLVSSRQSRATLAPESGNWRDGPAEFSVRTFIEEMLSIPDN